MNYWNSLLVEAIAGTGAKTRVSEAGASEDPISLIAKVSLRLKNCSGLLGSTVLGETSL